uniref:Uncharacterized protein n=1 Tax=viral metagenome TaxID=1070528 RepID=A0A6C0B796_9ZZZZ
MENKKDFHYVLSMGDYKLEDTIERINHITFLIGRTGKYTHTLSFDKPVTEKHAISEVEKYLSEYSTEEYYLKIKDDLYIHDDDKYYPVEKKQRYIFIMESCYLEIINYISYNHVMIECGS